MRITLILFGICLAASGCGSINQSRKGAGISRQTLFKEDGSIETTLFWAHYDATQRGGLYMVTKDNKVVVISEPPPDAATNSMLDIVGKAKVKDQVDAEAKVSAVRSIAELGKRTVAINLVRDIGFRIEALLNNNNGTIDAATATLYRQLLDAAKEISFAESNVEVVRAKSEILRELNSILSKADSTSTRPTYDDLLKQLEKLIK